MRDLNTDFLVDIHWLSEHMEDTNVVIVDCQWDTNAYIRAHIPGALMRPGHPYVKSENNGEPDKYLPTADEFSSLMAQLGIDNNTEVICYDEWDNHFSTRFWWVLTYYGHKKVKLLDGGWQAWVSAGLPVSFKQDETLPQQNSFSVEANESLNVTKEELLTNYDNPDWQVLDVRSKGEFDGKQLAGNKRGGHVPGAINLEWKELLTPENEHGVRFFRDRKEMQAIVDESEIDKTKTIAVHCQAGVRASFSVFCLHMLGYPSVKLYDGSMGEWANSDETPLEV